MEEQEPPKHTHTAADAGHGYAVDAPVAASKRRREPVAYAPEKIEATEGVIRSMARQEAAKLLSDILAAHPDEEHTQDASWREFVRNIKRAAGFAGIGL